MPNRYPLGARVVGADDEQLRWLIDRHPDREEKYGAGIDHFTVSETCYRSRGFCVWRTDGSGTDFSYRVSVYGRPSPMHQLIKTLRIEVNEDIMRAKQAWFEANG